MKKEEKEEKSKPERTFIKLSRRRPSKNNESQQIKQKKP